jgi:hypothetical protein
MKNRPKRILKEQLEFILIFGQNQAIQKTQMHHHECINKLLNLRINFNLVKNIISQCFHEHKNSKLIHFSSISKEANFRVLQLGTQAKLEHAPKKMENT